ncbi:MAG: tetratricopeptide repeat protein [Sphingobacteriaceae bacterium]|nr:tetratricopeptide repeat protein [Sphingobacteriaceae bacterium]
MPYHIHFILVFFLAFNGGMKYFAQTPQLDSLKLALDDLSNSQESVSNDSTRCLILVKLLEAEKNDAIWPKYNEQLKSIAEKNLAKLTSSDSEYETYKLYLGDALNNIGYLNRKHGDVYKALEYYNESFKIQEEIKNKEGIAYVLNNMGNIYHFIGDISRALEYYSNSLKIQEEIEDKVGMALSLNNIGAIYNSLNDIPRALDYFGESLKIQEEIEDKSGIAFSLSNIGFIYSGQEDFALALNYYNKSLKIQEEIGDKIGIAITLNNIGGIYKSQKNYVNSLAYYHKSLKIQEEVDDKNGAAYTLSNIGVTYLYQKNYSKALDFCLKSMKVSKELGFPENIKAAAITLNKVYKATNNHKLALENYELYIQMRDSINNESNRKASIRSQLKYEYEKQAAADSAAHAKESEVKNAELAKQSAEIKAKKNQQYALFGGLGLVMIFAGFMFNRFKVTQKQKGIIEHQKEIVEEQKKLVEEKQKEILDSIQYARRIQMAQIPSETQVKTMLNKLITGN